MKRTAFGALRRRAALTLAGALLLGAALPGPAGAATRIDLDRDWQFRTDPRDEGASAGWNRAVPTGVRGVELPHTWNIGADHDYLGAAWYFRRFAVPARAADAHVQLHFGATFYKARVWLNGVELGTHEGGFTAYCFDITAPLSGDNLLAVRIDNRPDAATIPGLAQRGAPDAWYDWWAYGGIVRDVWLTQTGPQWIERQRIRSDLAAGDAVVHDRLVLRNGSNATAAITLELTARDPSGSIAAQRLEHVELPPGQTEHALDVPIAHPRHWSLDHPDLYRLRVALRDAQGRPLDGDSETFGLRTVEIRDRHLLVNGERVRLTGLARHEDSPWEGLAETPGTMRRDLDDLKALHTTLTRPVHYPQNPFILDYADQHGMLLIPEIPVWQFSASQLADPRVLALARAQMQEMVEQAGNHPSIFAWSVANESATATPAGRAYFHAMREWIRSIDPGRYVSYADDNLSKLDSADQSAAQEADFLMMNQYFGSWHGPAAALEPALDRIDALFPDKMLIVSEFGYAGIFSDTPEAADRQRILTMQQQLPMLAARDWIGGAILWCYQDYKSRRNLWPGQTEGYVEHGLVDEARQRKPSYSAWKTLNAPARIQLRWTGGGAVPAGFIAQVVARTPMDLPYRPLHDYQTAWSIVDGKGRTLAGGTQDLRLQDGRDVLAQDLAANVASGAARLIVRLLAPAGEAAVEASIAWPPVMSDARP